MAQWEAELVARRGRALSGYTHLLAKIGAVSGASLALVGLLALAALLAPAPLPPEPVPPVTASSDAAAGGGWVPTGWRDDGTRFRCGMEGTDLVSSSDALDLELTGDVEPVDGGELRDDHLAAPVRITRTDAQGPRLEGGFLLLVFARDGLVVDIGRGWHEGGYGLPGPGRSADGVAEARGTIACGSWTARGAASSHEAYMEARPAGTYDVYAVMRWSDLSGTNEIAVSEPVTMQVPAVEVPDDATAPVEIRDGLKPPWLAGTTLACGVYASDIPGGPQVPSARPGLELSAEAAVGVDGAADSVTVTFTETEGEAVDTTRTPVTLIWLSYGRVVAVGSDVWSGPVEDLRVDPNGTATAVVPIEPDRTCLENPDAGMPAGAYDLRVLTEIGPGSGGERRFISVGTPSEYFVQD